MYDEIGPLGDANFTIGLGGVGKLAEMNKGVTPVFHVRPFKNAAKTAEAGRPIFDELECVMILVAGSTEQTVKPVDDAIKARFPTEYDAWLKKRESRTVSGTPIKQWPLLQPIQIAEFEALNIFSVEALAQIPDVSLQKAQGLREWREKARAWLETSKDGALAAKYAEENLSLRDEIAEMRKQVQALNDQVLALSVKKAKAA